MLFGFFRKRKIENEIERLKSIMKDSFLNVKDDLNKISHWISYLNEKDKELDVKIEKVEMKIDEISKELTELKEFLALYSGVFKQLFKHQTGVEGVQTPVQTGVQTALNRKSSKNIVLQSLTLMERAILWVLLNTDMKLSCEDIARVLGKNENTVRGQLNNLKTKWPSLVGEIIEKNGKKRYYVEEKTKELLLKEIKMKAKTNKKKEEREKSSY
ncbi:MAG: hypothetical protein QW244_01160 [Candidatus Pacearchaeota archaeon]